MKLLLCQLCSILILVSINLHVLQVLCNETRTDEKGSPEAPRSYSYSLSTSRVKDLIHFFEVLDQSRSDPDVAKTRNVILSLSASASKLHVLANGLPIETICSKYIKLLTKPNIRTVATISELMQEDGLFKETHQVDANIQASLTNEREFDALGCIQIILQTLEAEHNLGKSNLEPIVEKDLLDCTNYYVYRHQAATFKVIELVRESTDSLSKALIESSPSQVLTKRFQELIGSIKEIETNDNFDFGLWVDKLKSLQDLISKGEYQIPEYVRTFLIDSRRQERLRSLKDADKRSFELIERIIDIEQKGCEDLSTYKNLLSELETISIGFGSALSGKIVEFLNNATRKKYLDKNMETVELESEKAPDIGTRIPSFYSTSDNEKKSHIVPDPSLEHLFDDLDDMALIGGKTKSEMNETSSSFFKTTPAGSEAEVSKQILESLSTLNNECEAEHYSNWVDNDLIMKEYEKFDFEPMRDEILKTMQKLCSSNLQDPEWTRSDEDCNSVSDLFNKMRAERILRTG